jgi:hypothetical protein
VGGYKIFLEQDAAQKMGRGRRLLNNIARIVRLRFILAAGIQYITWQGFSMAHARDQKLIMIGRSDSVT